MRYKIIKNDQYSVFLLRQILRPYLSMISEKSNVEYIILTAQQSTKGFNYFEIYHHWITNEGWRNLVLERVAKIYTHIDFQMFPTDVFSSVLKADLMKAGIGNYKTFSHKNEFTTDNS